MVRKMSGRGAEKRAGASYIRLILFLTVSGLLYSISQPLSAAPRKIEAFQAGEQLHYKIKWGFLTAGYAFTSVVGEKSYKGTKCLLLQSGARSAGFLGTIYPVRDVITSCWDPRRRRTVFGEKRLKEGNYLRQAQVFFDHKKNSASWSEREYSGNTDKLGEKRENVNWKEESGVLENLPPHVHDMLSAVYYNRSYEAKGQVGISFYINVVDDGKLLKLKMEILRKEEIELEVDGKERTFRALVVRPHITTTGVFRSKGKLNIWIADDKRRWPLIIQAKAPVVGSLTARLYKTVGVSPIAQKN